MFLGRLAEFGIVEGQTRPEQRRIRTINGHGGQHGPVAQRLSVLFSVGTTVDSRAGRAPLSWQFLHPPSHWSEESCDRLHHPLLPILRVEIPRIGPL